MADLRAALAVLVARHPMLRACFSAGTGEPLQSIQDSCEVPVDVFEASGLDPAVLEQRVAQDYARPFDLAAAPLIRATIYRQCPSGKGA